MINRLQAQLNQIENCYHVQGNDMFATLQQTISGVTQDVVEMSRKMDPGAVVREMFKLQDKMSKINDANAEESKTLEDEFWESLEKQNFDFNLDGSHPMSSRWRRRIKWDKDLQQRYAKCDSRGAKQKFRQEWASQKYESYKKNQIHKVKLTETEINSGRYLPLMKIAEEEGGGEIGFQAAVQYCLRCMQVGGDFVWLESWSGQPKFLYYVRGRDDTFSKSWETHQKWRVAQKKLQDEQSGDGVEAAGRAGWFQFQSPGSALATAPLALLKS